MTCRYWTTLTYNSIIWICHNCNSILHKENTMKLWPFVSFTVQKQFASYWESHGESSLTNATQKTAFLKRSKIQVILNYVYCWKLVKEIKHLFLNMKNKQRAKIDHCLKVQLFSFKNFSGLEKIYTRWYPWPTFL